jgi:hypothetical protein
LAFLASSSFLERANDLARHNNVHLGMTSIEFCTTFTERGHLSSERAWSFLKVDSPLSRNDMASFCQMSLTLALICRNGP